MTTYLIEILFSIILGFVIGLEREYSKKYAGLKTHILVCLGACLFVLVSDGIEGATERTIAQIISGIGFIGAGTIMKTGNDTVKGITTASCLWLCAGIGISCGLGKLELATLVTFIAFISLIVLNFVERYLFKSKK